MTKVTTPEFRLAFPSINKPDEKNDGKYVITMLFDKSADLSALKSAAKSAAVEKWGDKVPKDLRSPFLDGDEKDLDGFAGCTYVRAKTKIKPVVVDRNRNEILEPNDVYAGCYCRASVVAFAYGGKGTSFEPGVAFSLQALQKLKDGEPFGGRNAALDFDELPEDVTKPNKPAAKAAPAKNAGLDDW